MPDAIDPLLLGQRVVAILETGVRVATYKLATLMALIDHCIENLPEHPADPLPVPIPALAHRVMELYWRQVRPFEGRDLRQSTQEHERIPRAVRALRAASAGSTLATAMTSAPEVYRGSIDEIGLCLAQQPLYRLQRLPGAESSEPFLYDDSFLHSNVSRRTLRDHNDSIVLMPGVATGLARLAGLLKPALEIMWVDDVRRMNKFLKADAPDVAGHLFGRDRIASRQHADVPWRPNVPVVPVCSRASACAVGSTPLRLRPVNSSPRESETENPVQQDSPFGQPKTFCACSPRRTGSPNRAPDLDRDSNGTVNRAGPWIEKSEPSGTFLRVPCHLITTAPVPIWYLVEDDDASFLKRNADASKDVLTAVHSALDGMVPAIDRTWVAYRGVPIDRFSAVLINGVDKDPTDAVIYCDAGPEKALEYAAPAWGATGQGVLYALHGEYLEKCFTHLSEGASPDEIDRVRKTYPYQFPSAKDGYFFARNENFSPGYDIEYGFWEPGNAQDALLGVFVRGRKEETVDAITTALVNVANNAHNSP